MKATPQKCATAALTAIGALAAIVCAPQPVWAEGEHWRAGMELGGAWRSGDTFAEALPYVEYAADRLGFGLGAPLRARMLDGAPKDGCKTPGLRCQDWDQASDFLRILRHLDLGNPTTTAQVHVGDLTGATVGHGSVVWRYYNNQLLDTWHTGAHLIAQGRTWGISALIGDVTRLDLAALRAHGRPLAGGLRPLEFGLQVAFDRRQFVVSGADGRYRAAEPDLRGQTTGTLLPIVSADLGWTLAQGPRGALTTWLDVVGQVERGAGAHLGMRLAARGANDSLAMTLEGRYAAAGYDPAVFGPLHELNWALPARSGLPAGFGSRATLEWIRQGWGRVVAALDQQSAQKLDSYLWLISEPIGDLSLRAFVARRWKQRAIGMDSVDWGPDPLDWLAYATAHLRVDGPWYAALSGGRRWRARPEWSVGQSPIYAELEVRLAAGAEFRF